jgi:hypothetical protein
VRKLIQAARRLLTPWRRHTQTATVEEPAAPPIPPAETIYTSVVAALGDGADAAALAGAVTELVPDRLSEFLHLWHEQDAAAAEAWLYKRENRVLTQEAARAEALAEPVEVDFRPQLAASLAAFTARLQEEDRRKHRLWWQLTMPRDH